MRVLVLGGTGGVGTHVLNGAVAAGHEVTVLARTPAKVDHRSVTVLQGDALNADSVRRAVAGQDVVVSCLGSTQGPEKDVSLRTMAANVADAMVAEGVRRVLWCASEGVDGEIPGLLGKVVMKVLAKPLADHRAAVERLRGAGLTVTVVRPRALNDGPLRTDYVEDVGGPSSGAWSVSRASVAHLMVKILADPAYEGVSVAVGDPRKSQRR